MPSINQDNDAVVAFAEEMEAMSSQSLAEARLPVATRAALDNVRALPAPGPTGLGDPALADLSIEQLQDRLRQQTTDNQSYWDEYGLSPMGHGTGRD